MGAVEGSRMAMNQLDAVLQDLRDYAEGKGTRTEILSDQHVRITRLIDGLPADFDFDAALSYRRANGTPQQKPIGLLLDHLFNHQTHHRGQASTLFHQVGVDIGVTDLQAMVPSSL